MKPHKQIDALLRNQNFSGSDIDTEAVYLYARSVALIEKSTVVVSDLKKGTSRVFHGKFSETLGLSGQENENSIWESEIFDRMSPQQLDEKYISELRFYNYLRHKPRAKRPDFFLATDLELTSPQGLKIKAFHKMYYQYENQSETVRFGICIYGPSVIQLPSKSIAVNSIDGSWEEISAQTDCSILTPRERQVLRLIGKGMTSQDIASALCISKNTVSRHRQEILAKLQARNSTEACRKAEQLDIL